MSAELRWAIAAERKRDALANARNQRVVSALRWERRAARAAQRARQARSAV
jgi:hypothetical protein